MNITVKLFILPVLVVSWFLKKFTFKFICADMAILWKVMKMPHNLHRYYSNISLNNIPPPSMKTNPLLSG